tara:strand:- start:2352 stop:2684 length:333 start_codon:yes stop_codon:yes gene_type:complete
MTESLTLNILSWISVITGCFFVITGGLGLIRLPDVFSRIHAAGITDTLGAGFIILGLMLQGGLSFVTLKLALVMIFIIFTSPTASHALANAAIFGGQRPWLKTAKEEKKS